MTKLKDGIYFMIFLSCLVVTNFNSIKTNALKSDGSHCCLPMLKCTKKPWLNDVSWTQAHDVKYVYLFVAFI